MAKLTVFENEGIEFVIDIETGEAFVTQLAYARISGARLATVTKRCQMSEPGVIKVADVEKASNSKILPNCQLIPASLCFQWLTKDNPKLALAMGISGAIVHIHAAAGFKNHRLNWN